jgi:hypothetical protein
LSTKSDEIVDNSPVVKLKRAIQKISKEIKGLNIAIGISEEKLMKYQLNHKSVLNTY